MLEFIGRAAEDLKLTGNVTAREVASRARVARHAINALRRQLKKLPPLSRTQREAAGVAARDANINGAGAAFAAGGGVDLACLCIVGPWGVSQPHDFAGLVRVRARARVRAQHRLWRARRAASEAVFVLWTADGPVRGATEEMHANKARRRQRAVMRTLRMLTLAE